LLARMGRRRALFITSVITLALAALVLARYWTTPAPIDPISIQAELEGRATLIACQFEPSDVRPGDTLEVSLYWLGRQGFETDIVSFVHLTPAAAPRVLAQTDQQPDNGFTPTTRWLVGEIIPDRHQLTLPADLSPGRYALYAGMYEPSPMRNLEIIASDSPAHSGRVLLGYLEVAAP
jgi:hypothetical protein